MAPPLRCTSPSSASSAASLFFQLAVRMPPPTTRHLVFLLPLRRYAHTPLVRPRTMITCSTAFARPNILPEALRLGPSARRFGTICVRNPQQDEQGKDMCLELTPRAAKRLSKIMDRESNPHLALRIQVESGGCHGFQYMMSLVTLPPAAAVGGDGARDGWTGPVIGDEDVIFQFATDEAEAAAGRAGDSEVRSGVPKIVVDAPSLGLLKGSKVDFTQELIGSQFLIADNPAAVSACGCGTSFDIKM